MEALVIALGPVAWTLLSPFIDRGGDHLEVNTGVVATSEESQKCSDGQRRDAATVFGALPDRSAMNRLILVRLSGCADSPEIVVPIRDVGPWRSDDPYWTRGARPAAEELKDREVWRHADRRGWFPHPARGPRVKACNGAGLDLSAAAWRALRPGISWKEAAMQREPVDWRFIAVPMVAE